MNRLMKLGAVSLLSLMVSNQAMAAFVLNGTRFIYEEGKKNTSFEVTNQSEDTYGGQVWIDNTNQGINTAFLIPVPPFFKVTPEGKQIVRIMRTDSALPADRESLFWLNVQEIPPKPKGEVEGGMLAVAINTRVKLIYRPKSLVEGRKDAEKGMQIVRRNGETWLTNPTPYYFAVTTVKVNGKNVSLNESVQDRLAQVAPKAEISLGNVALNGAVSVEAVNDWGGTVDYALK
ncbi:fimbrial chaperone [Salmonella enterica]|uniref:fimbrial chaperone n=1 Tax=Salmonella enterica TaxID=28901 RepID=UPI0019B0ABA1|nr:fimbrial chaperone [Salmonella enterica]WQG06125.1 fimbrial chaperone [Salmonella enterica subsp. enterica serovar Abortusovis]WQG10665.1 fimbrial chaperone [Salmonella enterica subsp. enterica serovar Abortusovis]WQG15095.1 fimbrial chaperone [Salmonella enterica subsp. enterica serovar Abortusovis]HAK5294526.1 fimbrial chaperone [Salmonella enterica]HDN4695302.1 fimbrial chaperone [Salmonella enterica subsp. enterica serovar Abortusovis]